MVIGATCLEPHLRLSFNGVLEHCEICSAMLDSTRKHHPSDRGQPCV
jgi:hypothetical protein